MSIADDILARAPLPTHLSSAEIRAQWSRRLREQAIFSARTTSESYLRALRQVLADFVAGRHNAARARELLLGQLNSLGYQPATGFPTVEGAPSVPPAAPGSLRDLSSHQRLNLILRINEETGDSLANLARSEDPAVRHLQPAWELIPGRYRRAPRDWAARWRAAGQSVAWRGVATQGYIALKDRPIWAAIGAGAGGYTDTLGNPYPPFAWGSSMIWVDVPRARAITLGLVAPDTEATS